VRVKYAGTVSVFIAIRDTYFQMDLLSKRRIRAPIHTKLDLERVKDAFDIMFKDENRVGKVILTP